MDSRSAARLQVLGAAALFSTGGAAIKACQLSPWQVAGFRSGVAAVALFALLPEARRGWSWRSWVVGLAYAATLTLYALANKYTTAANAIFLQSTAPLYMLLLGPALLREPVRARDLWYLGCLGLGMSLFFAGAEPATDVARDPVLGNALAAASGLTWALSVAGLRWLEREDSGGGRRGAAPATVAGNLIALGVALPFALPVVQSRPVDWALVAFLGVVQIGLAYLCLIRGVRHVRALEASLLLLLEPVLNPIWAWIVHAERPGAAALGGGAVILAATVANAWLAARRVPVNT